MSALGVVACLILVETIHGIKLGHDGGKLLSRKCLGCICEASSRCDLQLPCIGTSCGPFHITKPYWIDGGRPTLNDAELGEEEGYEECTRDPYCSQRAVEGYMHKFQTDCNDDGKIDCDDFAAIHAKGPFGCGEALPDKYSKQYLKCKSYIKLDEDGL